MKTPDAELKLMASIWQSLQAVDILAQRRIFNYLATRVYQRQANEALIEFPIRTEPLQ